MKKNCLHTIRVAIFAFFCVSFFVSNLHFIKAETVSRGDLGFDSALMKNPIEYTQNENIQVAPLFNPTGRTLKDEEWIRGIYFYTVERLGYPDIPFDYIISADGTIYQTSSSGDSVKVNILNGEERSILIGYLAQKNEDDFSDEAKPALKNLLLQVANNNSIVSTNIGITSLRFNINLTDKTSTLEAVKIVGDWTTSLADMKSFVSKNYSPLKKKYHVQITEVKAPTDQVQSGDTAVVELKVKNTGQNPIFADPESAILASKKDGKPSKFYLSDVWASQSQIPILSEGDIIKPDEEKIFQLKFHVPLYFGEQKEDFVIKDNIGNKIDGTDFSVTLNVANLTKPVVEILETGYGYLNVRSVDGGGAVLTKVSTGQRFIQLQEGEKGYVKIDLGNDKSGWVLKRYIKKVN